MSPSNQSSVPGARSRARTPNRTESVSTELVCPLDLPSRQSRETLHQLRQLAKFDSLPVCVVGPSGTGKSLYAHDVHACSPRSRAQTVWVNLAAIAKGLEASELLGHVEGAFTGAGGRRTGAIISANHGTLVLDEITKASRAAQHILLQVFDDSPLRQVGADRDVKVDVRIVALTSDPLERALSSGKLIPDLYERLNPWVVEIAPLKERTVDIPALITTIIRDNYAKLLYPSPPTVAPEVIEQLESHPFTGNHRELTGIVQRTLVNARGAPLLRLEHLSRLRRGEAASSSARSNRERWEHDQSLPVHRTFVTVADEARFYDTSVSTIHRWRAGK